MNVQDEKPSCHLNIEQRLFNVCLSHPSHSHDYNNQLLQDSIFIEYYDIMPIMEFFFFFFSFLFLVFKRAVILVYKENYKLKKKMVSLVSLEVVGVQDITAM